MYYSPGGVSIYIWIVAYNRQWKYSVQWPIYRWMLLNLTNDMELVMLLARSHLKHVRDGEFIELKAAFSKKAEILSFREASVIYHFYQYTVLWGSSTTFLILLLAVDRGKGLSVSFARNQQSLHASHSVVRVRLTRIDLMLRCST